MEDLRNDTIIATIRIKVVVLIPIDPPMSGNCDVNRWRPVRNPMRGGGFSGRRDQPIECSSALSKSPIALPLVDLGIDL